MTKAEVVTGSVCGICGKDILPTHDLGFVQFPNGDTKPCHLRHKGVEEEWQKQKSKK